MKWTHDLSAFRRGARLLLILSAVAAGVVATPTPARAQVVLPEAGDSTLWEFSLADGAVVVGRVVAATADRITIETAAGARVDVARAQVRGVRRAHGQIRDGAYWFEDPNHTRLLLISPTGRSLRQGEGYVSAFWIFLPFVAYGVTDNFTIAGGTPILPYIFGRVVYLAPKLRVLSQPGLDVSVGALSFFLTEEADEGTAGIAYGVGTFGNTNRSLTVGAGWAYAFGGGSSWADNRPAVLFGGDTRIARSVKLVTENFFIPGESGTLMSGGIRFFGERLAVDFGILGLVGDGRFDWFPAGNFVYNFGGR
ncbi:MAG: hypothetical protein WD801_06930 [Gemmatimonadaceae bacterium]